ncbi:MAG: hypothetical protein ACRDFX_04190 [Chloroflexota bacterium]
MPGVLKAGIVTLSGAALLSSPAISGAFASHAVPFANLSRSNIHHSTVNGALTVTNVLRVQKNASVYGHFYAHNGAQVWQGLLVRTKGLTVQSGGIKSDSLEISGPLQAQQAAISGNLQAGALSATSLSLTGGATIGGPLGVTGKLTGVGVDGGAGGLTTTGAVTASSVDSGSLSASSANLNNLAVTGNVNFSNATVTGLNLSSLGLTSLTFPTLNVGSPSSQTPPLNVSENGQTAQVGVDSNGNLTTRGFNAAAATLQKLSLGLSAGTTAPLSLDENGRSATLGVDPNGNLTLGGVSASSLNDSGTLSVGGSAGIQGGLTVSGSSGVTTGSVQAPNGNNGNSPGALSLSGGPISLSGDTSVNGAFQIANANDLSLSTVSSGGATGNSHIVAGGATDVAGTVSVQVPGGQTSIAAASASVSFRKPYGTPPVIVVTAQGDPAPGFVSAPKIWTTSQLQNGVYTGFVLTYVPPAQVAGSGYTVTYAYHVIGS